MAVPDIDPTSIAGIALTLLGYGVVGTFAILLSTIVFTPYVWYIIAREYGFRLVIWPSESLALRQKYPLFRFLWNVSLWAGVVLMLSIFGMLVVLVRYSV
jgi:hypothetical protein